MTQYNTLNVTSAIKHRNMAKKSLFIFTEFTLHY